MLWDHDPMEIRMTVSTGVFILSTSLMLLWAENSAAFSRPAESATFSLFFAGVFLLISSFIASTFSTAKKNSTSREYIPLSNARPQLRPSSSGALNKLRKVTSTKIRKTWLTSVFAVATVCLRVELHRRFVRSSHCSSINGLTLVPLILAAYECLISERNSFNPSRWTDTVSKKHFNYMLSAILLVIAGFLITSLQREWQSTFICPLLGYDSGITLFFQLLGAILDAALVLALGVLANCSIRGVDSTVWQTSTLWGGVLLGAAFIWVVIEVILLNVYIDNRVWKFSPIPSSYLKHTLNQNILFAIFCVSASKAVHHISVLALPFVFSSLSAYSSLLSYIWTAAPSFPVLDSSKAVFACFLLHGAGYLYIRSSLSPGSDGKRLPRISTWLCWIILASLGMSLTFVFLQNKDITYHPISSLITDAKNEHKQWITKASNSTNLKEAVIEYRRRYRQAPPPGFDVWYQYATNKSSLIIDDYDQIFDDLLPFRALSPKSLRDLVLSMTSDQWNEISAVTIRSGKAEPQAEINPTHRWMIEGIVKMVEPFARFLPDMDIAFNINDECRVAVPWEQLQSIKRPAKTQVILPKQKLVNSWSEDRTQSWNYSAIDDFNRGSLFIDHSFENVYDPIGRTLCSPKSKARTRYIWNKKALCAECARPHSLNQFLRHWKLSADICHQPDLAYMHGFFLSPASFKVSQTLLPIFSQSKVSGFNDILYPSAWNYIDKVKYEPSNDHPDPPYSEKEPAIFWRGTTSEGKSEHGTWKGMARQRLVHLANNHTSNRVSILLPAAKSGTFSHKTFQGSQLFPSLGLNTSIFIAESIARCGRKDCDAQTREFGTVPRSDFQDHWKYRFLFDMDGAGFSGRFLPFLSSRSLPFRTALFRQWLDSRLTPWLHFVPQDVRLHDVFSTLAYFAGAKELDAKGNVKRMIMKPHDREGEWIAEEGRKWAEKAIRKEDMEIYMFRLLLEWGRLTDDKRDELGFSI